MGKKRTLKWCIYGFSAMKKIAAKDTLYKKIVWIKNVYHRLFIEHAIVIENGLYENLNEMDLSEKGFQSKT